MKEIVYKVALGGLLHDIGKFMQRSELEKDFTEIQGNYGEFCPSAEGGGYGYLHAAHTAYFIEKFIPESIINNSDKTELYNAARHHKNPAGDIYREADCLSAGMERYPDEKDSDEYKKVRLHSIFDAIELQYTIHDKDGHLNSRWRYNLANFSKGISDVLYPAMDEEAGKAAGRGLTYRELWNKFQGELEAINSYGNLGIYFHSLYWLIEKYTWCISSATNAYPDISLFDHLKTTASIASCFYYSNQEKNREKPDFILYAGDISGIQDYIFKISQSQGIGGISKRLRGRSFYIAMLPEILSRHVVDQLGLTIANINYCGGGNFEILLPNTNSNADFLEGLTIKINEWLIEEFYGSLGFVDARVEMTTDELRDSYGEKKDDLADKLRPAKLKKYGSQLNEESFWIDKNVLGGRITICPSCNLKLIKEKESICELCEKDKKIGQLLPNAEYLAFSQSNIFSKEDGQTITFGRFGSVALLPGNTDPAELVNNVPSLYALKKNTAGGIPRYFLAQTLPVALKEIGRLESEKDENNDGMVDQGQTLSFSTLAEMAEGDKRIGILKMDVDNLGLIFSLGLDTPPTVKETTGKLRSISRLSNLSRQLSFFFTDQVDDLCQEIFEEWRNDVKNKRTYKNDISSIFYLIFAGGDDLVIVGPWDRIIDLARRIRKAFKNFTCHNPNITISAGIYICKPKFFISLAAEKAEEALKQSKDRGRNRITVMEETAVWDKEDEKSRVFQTELRGKYPCTVFDENEIHSEKIHLAGSIKANKPILTKTLTFEELTEFADELQEYYEDEKKKISRNFIFMLLRAKEKFFTKEYNDAKHEFVENHNYMFIPHLLYNIDRNASDDAKNELKGKLVTTAEAQTYIRQAYYFCKSILMKTKS